MLSRNFLGLAISLGALVSSAVFADAPISVSMVGHVFDDEAKIDPNITCANFDGKWEGSCRLIEGGKDETFNWRYTIEQYNKDCRHISIGRQLIGMNTVETKTTSAFASSNVGSMTQTTEVDRFSWDKNRQVIQMDGTKIYHRSPSDKDSLTDSYKGSVAFEGAQIRVKLEKSGYSGASSLNCLMSKTGPSFPDP